MICDVVSSSDPLLSNFPFAPGFGPDPLFDLLLNCSEFSKHGVASEVLVLLIQLLGVRRLVRNILLLTLLATPVTHVCYMRPVFRLHAVFSTALVFLQLQL